MVEHIAIQRKSLQTNKQHNLAHGFVEFSCKCQLSQAAGQRNLFYALLELTRHVQNLQTAGQGNHFHALVEPPIDGEFF